MLKVNRQSPQGGPEEGAWGPSVGDTLKNITGMIRRQLPVFVGVTALTITLGLIYVFTATPMYLATASMVIDTRHVQLFQQQSVMSDIVVDAGTVATQIELLKSHNVSLAVIKDQRLTDDPEFVGAGAGLIGALFNFISGGGGETQKPSETQLARRALGTFEGREKITRLLQSYVMEVAFSSADPEKAARIANGIVEAYINDQLEAKYQATKRASLWLQDRLKELRAQASVAQKAVVDFKQQNNIVDTGGGVGASGGTRLMSDQQLSEVNSQLIMSQAATAEAQARYDRIQEVMKTPIPDENVTDALKSEVIIKLRGQYLELAQKASIWTQRYGANHLATVNVRTQMLEIRRAISDEMSKIAQSQKSDLDIAKAREMSIRNSLASAISTTQTTNQAQVQLRELDSSAQSYRTLYDNFLQRYMEAVQQQSFPITEARLISQADRPMGKNSPKTALILLLTIVLGLVLSFAVALVREMSDRVFRSSEQVEAELQVNCLAVLPILSGKKVERAPSVLMQPSQLMQAPETKVRRTDPFYGHVLDAPFSQFAEGLRTVKVAMDLSGISRTRKVIGLTSTLPREGKSTIATNYAQLIAHSGSRVVLVDADLRNPTLSRYFGQSNAGIVDVLSGQKTLSEVLIVEPKSGMSFLPTGLEKKTPHTNELLASEAMKALVENLRAQFDYVIIDLPPLLPVVDARATVAYVDSYIYVVEWGHIKIEAVQHALSSAPELYENLLGVVVNKANLSVLRRYERYRGNYYNNKYYAQYGYTDRETA